MSLARSWSGASRHDARLSSGLREALRGGLRANTEKYWEEITKALESWWNRARRRLFLRNQRRIFNNCREQRRTTQGRPTMGYLEWIRYRERLPLLKVRTPADDYPTPPNDKGWPMGRITGLHKETFGQLWQALPGGKKQYHRYRAHRRAWRETSSYIRYREWLSLTS